MSLSEQEISRIVEQVLRSMQNESGSVSSTGATPVPTPKTSLGDGVFIDVDSAVNAASIAQKQFVELGFEKRREIIQGIRETALEHAQRLAELAVADTKMGRVTDKKAKNVLVATKTPGVEDLPKEMYVGDHGITLAVYSPVGVVGAITPTTNPTATIINNGIIILAAGNAVTFNPHPNAAICSNEAMKVLNRTIVKLGGPENLMTSVAEPSLRSSAELMKHKKINLIVATGGGGVVRAAMESGKRAMVAGPGNPPVIVDETADIEKAAQAVVRGAAFDNNMPCICEKECFVVRSVADKLIDAMQRYGAYLLSSTETDRLKNTVLNPDGSIKKEYVGKNANVILNDIGVRVGEDKILAICETETNHPFVQTELMMPILAVVKVNDYDQAVEFAFQAEHGLRHTSMIHSKNIGRITHFAKKMSCNLFVANSHCGSVLGYEAEGPTAFSIAGPTGEGELYPRHFLRKRRMVLRDVLEVS
jgi:propionaldehyde dehydrogenase